MAVWVYINPYKLNPWEKQSYPYSGVWSCLSLYQDSCWRDVMWLDQKGHVCSLAHFLLGSLDSKRLQFAPFLPVPPLSKRKSALARIFFSIILSQLMHRWHFLLTQFQKCINHILKIFWLSNSFEFHVLSQGTFRITQVGKWTSRHSHRDLPPKSVLLQNCSLRKTQGWPSWTEKWQHPDCGDCLIPSFVPRVSVQALNRETQNYPVLASYPLPSWLLSQPVSSCKT